MSISNTNTELPFLNVVAGVAISCNMKVYDASWVQVLYGSARAPAVYGVDYTVTLSPPDYNTFIITPTPGLIAKLGNVNKIIVRRDPKYLSAFTAETSFVRERLAEELDRALMRDLDHDYRLRRTLRVPGGDGTEIVELPDVDNRKNQFVGFNSIGQPRTYTTAEILALLIDAGYDPDTPNSGTFQAPWMSAARLVSDRLEDEIHLSDFADLVEGDDWTLAAEACADYVNESTGGRTIILPPGRIRLTRPWVFSSKRSGRIVGQGKATDSSGNGGTALVFDNTNLNDDGLVFDNADWWSVESLGIIGPIGTRRATGGALFRMREGSGGVIMTDVYIDRGYRNIHCTNMLGLILYNVKSRYASGPEGVLLNGVGEEGTANGMAGTGVDFNGGLYRRSLGRGTGSKTQWDAGVFTTDAGLAAVEVFLIERATGWKTKLVRDTDYSIVQTNGGVRITFVAAPTNAYNVYIIDPNAADACVVDGRGGSVDLKMTGGFCRDWFVVRNSTGTGWPGNIFLTHRGTENVGRDSVRIEAGVAMKIVGMDMAADGYAVNVIGNTVGVQNIVDIMQTPGSDTITIQHVAGLTLTDDAPLFITGVQGVPGINGRAALWQRTSSTRVELLYRTAVKDDTGEIIGYDDPFVWAPNDNGDYPVYVTGTGNVRTEVPFGGAVQIIGARARGCGKGGFKVNGPAVLIADSAAANCGRNNKRFFGYPIASIAAGPENCMRLTLTYRHDVEELDQMQIDGLFKAGVRVTTMQRQAYSARVVSSTVVDLVGSTYDGPYDSTVTNKTLLIGAGAGLYVGPNASGLVVDGGRLGSGSQDLSLSIGSNLATYGIINECADRLSIRVPDTDGNRWGRMLNRVGPRTGQFIDLGTRTSGYGSPEGNVAASVGSTYEDLNTGITYRKELGDDQFGWTTSFSDDDLLGVLGLPYSINQIEMYGQSLILGTDGRPVLSTDPVAEHFMFVGGVRTRDSSDVAAGHASLVPLREIEKGTLGETPASAAARMFSQLLLAENGVNMSAYNQRMLWSNAGEGGKTVAELSASPYIDRVYADIEDAQARALELQKSAGTAMLLYAQGETDYSTATPQADYKAAVQALRTLIRNSAATAADRSDLVLPCILSQLASHAAYSRATPTIAMALFELARDDPSFGMIAAPNYIFTHDIDDVHLVNTSYRHQGAYFGLAMKRWLVDGVKPPMIIPRSATRAGNVITITYDVPVTPLVFDTVRVSDPGNKGFTVVAADNSPLTITSTGVLGGNKVQIALSAAVPAGAKVRYAWAGGSNSGPTTGPRGCLRDSNALKFDPTGLNLPMYSWGPISEIGVA